jgi:hypothetical protein
MNLASRPFLFPFCLLILAGVVASAGYFLDEYLSPSPHTTFKGAVADKIDTMLDVIFKNNAKEEDVLSIDRGNSDSKNSNSGSDSIDENEAAAKNDEDSSSRGPNAPNARSLSNERFLNNFWPKRYAFQAKLSLDSRLRGRGGGGRRPKKINSYSASPTRTTTLKVIGLAAGTKKTDIKTRMIRTTRTAECTRRTFLPLRTTPLFL